MSRIMSPNPILHEEKNNYLRAKDLDIFYFNKKIINRINFAMKNGDCVAIMGPNGAGKSTLLNTLAGIHAMYKGEISFSGSEKPSHLPQRFEGDRTFPLNTEQVVAMGNPNACADSVQIALEEMGLRGDRHKPLLHLSAGQFQRMLFARLFLQDRTIILLDEPFSGMDEKTIQDLLACLERWAKVGKIILVAQHNRERALNFFPKTLLLGANEPLWGETRDILGAKH